jgi:hypothetical protein
MVSSIRVAVFFVISLASLHCFSLPLTPLDSRSIGMGGTGVASARAAHAVRFNPALLSFANSDEEDVSLIFPQFGATAADEEELFDSITDFIDADYVDLFETSVDNIRANVSTITSDAAAINAAAASVDVATMQTAVNNLNASTTLLNNETIAVDQNTDALIINLANLDSKAVRGKVGGSLALAFPSQDFAMAFSVNAELDFSGVAIITPSDLSLLDIYSDAASTYSGSLGNYATTANNLLTATTNLDAAITAGDTAAIPGLQTVVDNARTAFNNAESVLDTFNFGGSATPADNTDGDKVIFSNGALASDADDVDLTSNGHFVAVTTMEFGVSFAKSFRFGNQAFSIGITPKLQEFGLYDYYYQVEDDEDIDFDDILDTEVSESAFNIDIGIAQSFGKNSQWRVAAVIKNLIKQEFQTQLGADIEIAPQARAGIAYNWGMLTLAADYDLTENDNLAFGGTTQYAMFGAEVDLFKSVQFRMGYRTDTANTGFDSYSAGFGFSPWGVHLDLSGFVNTTDVDNEAGVALEFGVEW